MLLDESEVLGKWGGLDGREGVGVIGASLMSRSLLIRVPAASLLAISIEN